MSTTAPKFSFYQGPNQVPTDRPLMPWGTFWGDLITLSGKNSPPQASETWTIAVPGTVENAAAYYVSEGGVQAVHLTDSTSQDDLGNGLVSSIGSTIGSSSAGGTLSSRWSPVYDESANLLTLTANWPGVVTGTWTVSPGFTDPLGAPSKIVDAAFAARVKAGRALVAVGSMPGTAAGTRLVFQPIASDFDAQVVTHTITAGAGDSFQPILTIGGQTYYGASVPFDTNADTTAVNIAAAIEALAPADVGVLGTSSTNTVISTAEVPGSTFSMQIIASGPTAVAAHAATTGPNTATSLERAFIGISERGTDVEAISNDSDEGSYGRNEGVRYVTRGIGTVERPVGETWVLGDGLWIVLDLAREDSGKFGKGAGAGRIWMPPRTLVVDQGGGTDDTTTGVIRLHLGA